MITIYILELYVIIELGFMHESYKLTELYNYVIALKGHCIEIINEIYVA